MSSSATSSRSPAFKKAQYFTRSAGGWCCNICTSDDSGRIMSAQDALNHERNSAKHGQNVADTEMWWCPAPSVSAWLAHTEDPPATYEEMKMRESQIRVDHVKDMIPFWMRGVEAAERGEVLKMEEFLNSIKRRDPWGLDSDPWGLVYSPGDWGEGGGGGWGKEGIDDWGKAKTSSSVHERKAPSRRVNDKGNGWGDSGGDGWDDWGKATTGSSLHGRRTASRRVNGKGKEKTKKRSAGWQIAGAYDFVEGIARRESANGERRRRMHKFFEMNTQDKIKKIEEVIRFLRETR